MEGTAQVRTAEEHGGRDLNFLTSDTPLHSLHGLLPW